MNLKPASLVYLTHSLVQQDTEYIHKTAAPVPSSVVQNELHVMIKSLLEVGINVNAVSTNLESTAQK